MSVKEPTARGVRLYAKSLQAGTPVIQVRLGSATGPVITQQEVDEFTLQLQATTYIGDIETFPDGALRLETNLQMDPKVENLAVASAHHRHPKTRWTRNPRSDIHSFR